MIDKLARAFTKLLAEVKELRADVQNMPTPKNGEPGKPGVSPEPEAIAELVLAQLPEIKDGEPGKDADIEAVIKEVLAQIPTPKDGKPGRDAQPPLLADVAALVLAQIPKPKDGVSPDPKALAAAAAKLIPKPKDGVSPSPKSVAALVKVPTPKQGKPGKNGASVTDVRLERNILSVWIDGVKKRVGKIDPPAQPAFQGGGALGGAVKKGAKVERRIILTTASFTDQEPATTDTAVEVLFGTTSLATPEIEYITNATTRAYFKAKKATNLDFRFIVQYGRTGAAGVSWLYARILLNGNQISTTVLGKLNGANDDFPGEFNFSLDLVVDDEVSIEIMRGSEGNDSGGLISVVPVEGTWNPVASATMVVSTYQIA